jgi:hypothetical protein
MIHRILVWAALLVVCGLISTRTSPAAAAEPSAPKVEARIKIGGHPWRPPFGLDRIGAPLSAVITVVGQLPAQTGLTVVAYSQGKEVGRTPLKLTGQSPFACQVSFEQHPTELVLIATSADGVTAEWARQNVELAPFEAEAAAVPASATNPVDLGAILVPNDYLLLAAGQIANIDVAAVSHKGDMAGLRAAAWFESAPNERTRAELALTQDHRVQLRLPCPPVPAARERDQLQISIASADGAELWHKTIPTMLVQQAPKWPDFGAARTKLRYDAPISVRGEDGKFSSLDYDKAWDPKLDDVVVALPNGSRFVFWRGSSYVPFWAGRCNTGLSYEWAETSPPADGYTDCVEPLMDKELRYGRVEIVESTPARVHVRWTYQSCDFMYKVWGDSAIEDFYFYRDGWGTRVLTLQSDLKGDYELSEFIILTPRATYPFSALPRNIVDLLFVDGEKRELTFPFFRAEQGESAKSREVPAVYRVRLHRDEPLVAVYFNPLQIELPPAIFDPFFDQGLLVTPTYWGSHWPLARGKTTGYAIDDRVNFSPCHNSVMSWARSRPAPLHTAQVTAQDTLGRTKPMLVQTWTWLIGMSDEGDSRLIDRAKSFAQPPAIEPQGARLETDSYSPERRALRMIVEQPAVTIKLKPAVACVNPVFELANAPQSLQCVQLGERKLDAQDYAWDGHTLWINATLTQETQLQLQFATTAANPSAAP